MKFPLIPAWMLCILTGNLFAAAPGLAQSPTPSGPSTVTAVRFCPRTACANRMVGGKFQGSSDNSTWTTLATEPLTPSVSHWTTLKITSQTAFRYLRYLSPNGGYGNIAELEFDGGSSGTKLVGTPFGTPGSFAGRGNTLAKVFDGSFNTFFDAPGPNGNFVGLDLGPAIAPPAPAQPPVILPPVEPALPPVALPPTAPAGLAATTLYIAVCAQTNAMPMPHISLSWNSVPGASYYTMYRNGAAVQVGVTSCAWTDMDLTSGQTYAYAVSATGPGGEGPQSAPISVTAPSPPTGTLLPPPVNVRTTGVWQGAAANILAWDAVPGAASYNIYASDVKIASVTSDTSYAIGPDLPWYGVLYTVTSVDGTGAESIPSALTPFHAINDPNQPAVWWALTPLTPDTLAATPEWNQGNPRILLTWHGRLSDSAYCVYRDGVKIADSIWHPYYIDTTVGAGETHSYAVMGVNTDWPTPVSGTLTASVSVTALLGPPAPLGGKVLISKVVANDDSAEIFITPVPGATDYRIYDIHDPTVVKYAGMITNQVSATPAPTRMALSIEWNGIDTVAGADLVVEAVDKLGPFSRMDGTTGAGVMNMNAANGRAINGQGDPSNAPLVLATSDPVHVNCVPTGLSGAQAFFDNFHTSQPFTLQPQPTVIPVNSQYYGSQQDYAAYDNDKWEIRQYGADLTNSKFFVMNGHFMDTTYDGGGPGSVNGPHNNVASMVMMPKATADISGGKVLHVTFEVDAHMGGRRWVEVGIGEAGDQLIDIAKFEDHNLGPTVSGKFLRWQIQREANNLDLFPAIGGAFSDVDLMQYTDWNDTQSTARMMWDHTGPFANGTQQDIDKRHKFDLYVSQNHYRLQETTPDGSYNIIREKDFPAGTGLPFTNCQVYFIHQVYHTFNDRTELIEWYPYESYWYDQRPHSDERHWDNMGFEVLNAFPAAPGS